MEYAISCLNVVAFYLAIKGKRVSWAISIMSTFTMSLIFWNNMMFSSFVFNVYSTLCSIIALFTWTTSKNIISYKNPNILQFIILNIGLFIVNYYVFKSENIFYDTFGPACAITATYMLVNKNAFSYIYWILSDINYLLWGEYPVLYSIMLCLSIYGIIDEILSRSSTTSRIKRLCKVNI